MLKVGEDKGYVKSIAIDKTIYDFYDLFEK